MKRLLLVILTAAGSLYAVGDQHGIFASRSTQGALWQGTSSVVKERYRITVMPAYLDVELNLELTAGGAPPDSFRNALEIVGNMNLAQDASVVGMLLWNGDQILKAKLKPLLVAKQQYEQVVDRNAEVAPRPRDPVIFQYGWARDNYDLSVFPAAWGASRTLRMRYLIPVVNINGSVAAPYPYAFNPAVASVTLVRGTGVGSFSLVYYNGQSAAVTADSLSFACSGGLYGSLRLIAPQRTDTARTSVLYTAQFETPQLVGAMTQVIGLPAGEIVRSGGIKEDFVILWRWNHPEALTAYASQLVKQAALLKKFCVSLDAKSKRAALIIDMAGGEIRTFQLSAQGAAAFSRMTSFLDSIAALPVPAPSPPRQPSFTPAQIDSMATESVAEFKTTLAVAAAMFDAQVPAIRRIVVVTAGPRWVADTRMVQRPASLDSVLVMSLAQACIAQSIPAGGYGSEFDLYWPGVNIAGMLSPASALTVTAEVGNGAAAKSKSFAITQNASSFSWGYVSPDLDMKLYSTTPLQPVIRWKVLANGRVLAEYDERPAVVPIADGMQFARALAGSKQLQGLDAALPSSLAETFGFVDTQYALLALEQDVMDSAAQQRYRFQGVPPLAWDEITPQPDTSANDVLAQSSPAGTAVERRAQPRTIEPLDVSITVRADGRMTIALGEKLRGGREIRALVYTVSGRLVASGALSGGAGGRCEMRLPGTITRTQQFLIVRIDAGEVSIVKRVMVR